MRRVLRSVGAALLGVALAAPVASAQIEAGDKSVAVTGQVMSGTGDASFTMGIGILGYNYFQTRNFAWRITLGVITSDVDEESSTSTIAGGGVEWNFGKADSKTVPFVAFDVSSISAGETTAIGYGPSAGFRTFLTRSTSFDVTGNYTVYSAEGDSAGILGVRLGFSYFIGKDARR